MPDAELLRRLHESVANSKALRARLEEDRRARARALSRLPSWIREDRRVSR